MITYTHKTVHPHTHMHIRQYISTHIIGEEGKNRRTVKVPYMAHISHWVWGAEHGDQKWFNPAAGWQGRQESKCPNWVGSITGEPRPPRAPSRVQQLRPTPSLFIPAFRPTTVFYFIYFFFVDSLFPTSFTCLLSLYLSLSLLNIYSILPLFLFLFFLSSSLSRSNRGALCDFSCLGLLAGSRRSLSSLIGPILSALHVR